MRKWNIIIISNVVILGIIIGFVALYFHSCVESFPFDLSSVSPDGTYQVHLKEKAEVSLLPFPFAFLSGHGDHEVHFTTTKSGKSLIENQILYSGDGLDDRFLDKYPEHQWMSNSILRFGHNVAESEKRPDSLTISNDTNKTIKYLQITAKDMLFVFEIPPKSKMKLQVPHQGWLSWVKGNGEFADGLRLKGNGVGFYHKDKINEPLRYCLSVEDDAIKVESPIMDGHIGNGTEETKIPKATNCDL